MKALQRTLKLIDTIMEWTCHALLTGILAVTVMQVFLRFIVNNPTSWSEEVALLMLIWFGLIGCGIMVGRNGHIAITYFRDILPRGNGIYLDLFADVAVLVFSLFLVSVSGDLIKLVGYQIMPASGLSRAWLYWPVAAGGCLMVLNGTVNLLTTLCKLKEHLQKDNEASA
ncbi:TRAP transporter small permease [Rhodobacteraceae bacterium RKSG542]|uniref:TRAP transporter small permease n=1 Tax=Pseudovibrio flavus TaxID=2529854 RepID=UPI0012BB6CB8|nr:TRAP transporter small permease [Pseudovibrio flavus]MTI18959.1 TRAP transporter small permease [Pseudovibrio flavus]